MQNLRRLAFAALAGLMLMPVGVARASAPGGRVWVRAGAAVGVPAGDYQLIIHGLHSPSANWGAITQRLGGEGAALRVADLSIGPSATNVSLPVRIAGPTDTFSVAIPSSNWTDMQLASASWSFLVRGQQITVPGGAALQWHGLNATQVMTGADFDKLYGNGARVARFFIDERCWDSFFTSKPPSCPSNYQGIMKAAVSAATAHGLVAVINPDDAGRDSANWSPSGQADDFGPDQHTLSLWHQMDALWANNPHVVFETINEPKMTVDQRYSGTMGADLWRTGGLITLGSTTWQEPGVQQIVNTIRGDGANNLIFVEGAAWGSNLTPVEQIPVFGTNLVYSFHGYRQPDNATSYPPSLDWAVAPLFDPGGRWRYAGMLTEFGTRQTDTTGAGSQYLSSVIDWAQAHNLGWLAYAWFPSSWDGYGLLKSLHPLVLTSRGQTVVNRL